MNTLLKAITQRANERQVEGLARFFKTGPGQYGEGDKFLGIKVPVTREVVKACWRETTLQDLEECIASEYHEVRLAALERRQLHIEAIFLLQGLALIMPTHRKPAALQNHALELLNAVIQLRPGIPEIFVELLVDLLQRHCVNNHSRSVTSSCKDNQKWPDREITPFLVKVVIYYAMSLTFCKFALIGLRKEVA